MMPDQRADDAAVQPQAGEADATVGRDGQDRPDRVSGVDQVPLVDDVVQPTADDGEDGNHQAGVPEVLALDAAPLQLAHRDREHDRQSGEIAQRCTSRSPVARAG
jgi:hypothetical protein